MNDPHEHEPRRPWRTDEEWLALRARMDAAAEDPAPHPSSPHLHRRWLAGAAAVAIAAAGVMWYARPDDAHRTQIATQAGERRSVRLPDGSIATLGPASTLSYRMGPNARDLQLTGLADFSVQHDTQRPFVVRARNAVTTDVGTEFTVRAYRTDSAVTIVVSSGKVELRDSSGRGALNMTAGEMALVSTDGAVLPLGRAHPASTAWLSGALVFDNMALSDVAQELTRWFGATVRVRDAHLGRRRITAQYVRPMLDDVLGALTTTLQVSIEHRDGTYTFVEKPR